MCTGILSVRNAFHAPYSLFIKTRMSQIGYKDAVEYYGESFGRVKTDGTYHFFVIHSPRHFILEDNQGSQNHFTLGKSM